MILLLSIALLSALFHIFLEAKGVKEQIEATGKNFTWKEQVQRNYFAWIGTCCWIGVVALAHHHMHKYIPESFGWTLFLMGLYAISGYGGSSFATDVLSTSQKQLTAVIKKTITETP